MPYSANRTTEHGIDVVRLTDSVSGTGVAVAPSIGNRAFEMKVNGENILYFPFAGVAELKANSRSLNGIPFLAPWATRAADGALHINGKTYPFNESAGTLRLDANGLPIHGMLYASPFWEVLAEAADDEAAWLTSRLEFWKHPSLMANWPFAHDYEMTYRLSRGVLEVRTTLQSRCDEPMPIAIGFHPYFNLPGVPRNESVAGIPANSHVETDSRLVATGEFTPANLSPQTSLSDHKFDDGFTDIQDPLFYIEGRGKRIEVTYGLKYPVAVVYAPPGHDYICFEPMTTVTNGINLAAQGKYPALQWLEPGAAWTESFWIATKGF